MKKYVISVYTMLFLVACNHSQKVPVGKTEFKKSDSLRKVFEEDITAFNFHIDDSVCLIFSNVQSFDTSLILILKRRGNEIKGSFLYYPPAYYSNFGEWQDLNVFLFKSINFTFRYNRWLQIASEIKAIPDTLEKSKPSVKGKIHPAFNKLYFENKILTSSNTGSKYFDQIYEILARSIFVKILSYYPIIDGKVP